MLSVLLLKRYFFSKKSVSTIRSIARLCLLGVAIGVCAFIVVMSVMNGFSGTIERRFLALEPHLIVDITDEGASEEVKLVKQLSSHPNFKSFSVTQNNDAFIRTFSGLFNHAEFKGFEREHLKSIFQTIDEKKKKAAQFQFEKLSSMVDELEYNEVFIGYDLAYTLGVYEGETILVVPSQSLLMGASSIPKFEKVTIKGIFRSDVNQIDSNSIFYLAGKSLNSLKTDASRKDHLEVKLHEANKYQALKAQLEGSGFKVQSWKDRNSSLFLALKLEKFIMGLFLGLSALVTMFSIVTVLSLMIHHKKSDIGILMTMGLSPKKTQNLFTLLGVMLFAVGLVMGVGSGVLISWLLQVFPVELLPSEYYYDTVIPSKLQWPLVFIMMFVGSVVALIVSVLPVKYYVRFSPVEALRS